MYTEIKSYQILIALLKEYGIKHCVLSAGSRNVPFVHSVEEDDFFKCYSVVDERSAGYFALGLAQELNEPVLISCTASTASCNYWPPVAEAFYQRVPIIVLTSDRDFRMLGQWEDQMINQVGMFDRHVQKSVNLPIINTVDDEIYCQRLINEAFLELNHNGRKGPIHINVPTYDYNMSFNVKELPKVKKIERISLCEDKSKWDEKVKKLQNCKKVLVVCGQKSNVTPKLEKEIKDFFKNYNATIVVDHMSNVQIEEGINTITCFDPKYSNSNIVKELLPDVLITFGGQIFSSIKEQFRKLNGKFEHWSIEEDGQVVDTFKSLKTIFECQPEYFFEYFNKNSKNKNSMEYYNNFKKYSDSVEMPEFRFSHIYAIKNVVQKMPSNSILHLSVNDSIRIANYFKLNNNIKTYANIGTYGIDGPLSTFLGQATVSNKESFLVIGDLAFFYDMNALRINSIKKNVHILMINNHGGSEFYYNKTCLNKSGELHTSARHNTKAKGWVEENNFTYLSANDKESFEANVEKFMKIQDEKPVFFEVFTEMKDDAQTIFDFYDFSSPRTLKDEIVNKSKNIIKGTIGQDKAKKIINILKKN